MRRLRIPNIDLHKEEKTYLDADYSTGSTALTVINALGFASGEVTFFGVIGEPGEDKTEAQQVSSITGYTQVNFPATFRFNHNKSTPLYRSVWDQVEISKMTVAGAYGSLFPNQESNGIRMKQSILMMMEQRLIPIDLDSGTPYPMSIANTLQQLRELDLTGTKLDL